MIIFPFLKLFCHAFTYFLMKAYILIWFEKKSMTLVYVILVSLSNESKLSGLVDTSDLGGSC